MSTNCLESSSVCIVQRISKAPASAWPPCNALFTSMEAECGRRANWTRAQPSISPSVRERTLVPCRVMSHTVEERASRPSCRAGTPASPPALERKLMKQRLEADHELRGTRHTVGGRQSGRRGSCPACAAAGKVGEPYLRRTRWRGGPGLSLLPRSVLGKIVRSSPQVGAARFETAQSGWDGSAQTGQERPSDQDHPGRHYDFVERRAGLGGWLQPGGEQLYPEAGRLRPVPGDSQDRGTVLAGHQSAAGSGKWAAFGGTRS